ncbi:hypothetical protein ACS0TY_013468 [Phlomoides rotata]
MLSKQRIDICYFQETKVDKMKESIFKLVWGVSKFDWACKDSKGRAGGILTIWNDEVFCKTSSFYQRVDGSLCCIINVYTLFILSEKIILWDEIITIVEQFRDICVYVVGDFNSIRKDGERVGKSGTCDRRDISVFDFITQNNLIELPLVIRLFTWYRAASSCKSKLDCMLVNDSWLKKWSDLMLKGLGWGAFILKEKLKHMKTDLKEWNKKTFGLIDLKIEEKKAVIANLDLIDDTFGLYEE